MATAMGGRSSHGNSSESEYSAPETFQESSNSPLRSPDTTTVEHFGAATVPYLQLVEPPVESCRFRYPTEMKGTHGSILGISTLKKENARKKIFPSVKLHNYHPSSPDTKVIIRCTLTTADEDESARFPHVHQLKGKGKTPNCQFKEIDDPIDIVVKAPNYQATFGNMTILYIKKKDQLEELLEKKRRHIQSMYPFANVKYPFNDSDNKQLLENALKEVSKMNSNRLNTACLKFEALELVPGTAHYNHICRAIYSNPIKNPKNAQFNDLRICRIDKVAGTCLGREEVFIFVEKVSKKDIKIRFFELNENEEEIWEDYADLGEEDVHYQYAIAFRTPPYKNLDITDNVQVYFQLERPSNGSRSAPKEFEYTPNPDRWQAEVRKRPRLESPTIPATVQDLVRPSTSQSWSCGSPSSADASLPNLDKDDPDYSNLLDELSDWFLFDPSLMNVESESSSSIQFSNPSVTEALSSFDSGDSDAIMQMIKSPDAMRKWASCHGYADNVIDQIVTSTEHPQQLRTEDDFETDGTVHHQSGMELRPTPISRAEHQMAKFKVMEPQMFSRTIKNASEVQNSEVQTGSSIKMNMDIQLQKRSTKKLSRDNIVLKVTEILNCLFSLKRRNKIQEEVMKHCLLRLFISGLEESNDRVLHVLAPNPVFPQQMMEFLQTLKRFGIAERVVNLKNNRGQTALHLAAERGNLQTIELLVDHKADVNARDINLNTPLHLIANREDTDAFHALSKFRNKDLDVTLYNGDGLTALHLFVLQRKASVASCLIIKTEDKTSKVDPINQPDRKQGNTPLHMAVQKKYLEIVRFLLNLSEGRIDVNARNFDGKTPLAYVSGETVDDRKIEELLLQNNADPALVPSRGVKINKELKNEKNEADNDIDDDVQEVEDVDESLPSYAQEWKSEAELKLLDINTICSVCAVLDDNYNWISLLKYLDLFEDDFVHFLQTRWSPTLHLLKAVAKKKPDLTSEMLRDTLMKVNDECKKAAQFIDDMFLRNMGVL